MGLGNKGGSVLYGIWGIVRGRDEAEEAATLTSTSRPEGA
jgi:hypothetical protein